LISKRDKDIDDIIKCEERKTIEDKIKDYDISLLFSYNVSTRSNLINECKNHKQKEFIYS